ncbi:hypothetical protein THRCLA_20210 [Thraustotheca clavata]|uniref:Uncharacterized protein n=1 Tax=Thraustotheca clavata TaxID=74557 RepID=A0A1W0AAX9_9STRA|nr:hypothetical protein THRCLA_20210 [Thraustotheca clavata]
MRRVESQMAVASAPMAMPAKSRSAGGDRKRSLHRFVVTDAPEDPEVMFSPRTAKPPDKILEGTRTRPGKTEQKGRFTIIELVPTSPGAVDTIESPKPPKEVEMTMSKQIETKPSAGNEWVRNEGTIERPIATNTSGEQRVQASSTSMDRVLHELVDESTKHRNLLMAMLDRNSELLNELKAAAHNCHCNGSMAAAEPVDILGQAAEIKRLNDLVANLTRENQRLEQKNALLEIRLHNQLAVSNDLRQELRTLTNYTESLVQQHEIQDEEPKNNGQLSPSNATVDTASPPPSPSQSLESDSPPVANDPPKSIPQAPPPPPPVSKIPEKVSAVNRLKSPITITKQPTKPRPLTRSSASSDALDKMMFSQMHLMTKELASTKPAQFARYSSPRLIRHTSSPQKLNVPGSSAFDLFKVPSSIGTAQGVNNNNLQTTNWPSLTAGLAPALSAAQLMHPLPRNYLPDGTRAYFTQPHEHFTSGVANNLSHQPSPMQSSGPVAQTPLNVHNIYQPHQDRQSGINMYSPLH